MEHFNIDFNITKDIINSSSHIQLRNSLIESFSKNRKIEDPAYHILICLYSILIIVGATGNSLVVMAVARKPIMRTARNMFIVNLAISGKISSCLTHFNLYFY
jgi:neuropeptide F receptor